MAAPTQAEDQRQAEMAVEVVQADLLHEMDVKPADCGEDGPAWLEWRREGQRLLLRAYYRNHTKPES